MSKQQKKVKAVDLDSFSVDSPSKKKSGLEVVFEPRNKAQQAAVELWKRSRILFLLGPAGTGKSAVSMALALKNALAAENGRGKIMLTRPMVTVGEPLGFLPGDVNEKTLPWLLPFADVLSPMTFTKFEELNKHIDVEVVPIGMLRGRTIRDGTLICSEMQNASYEQLKCALTRIGPNSRIIVEGDPYQSDCYDTIDSPLLDIARKLHKLDTVSYVKFDAKTDQLRDPLISDMLDLL